jgi:hypothetical protein
MRPLFKISVAVHRGLSILGVSLIDGSPMVHLGSWWFIIRFISSRTLGRSSWLICRSSAGPSLLARILLLSVLTASSFPCAVCRQVQPVLCLLAIAGRSPSVRFPWHRSVWCDSSRARGLVNASPLRLTQRTPSSCDLAKGCSEDERE